MREQEGFYNTKENKPYWSIKELQQEYPEISFTDDTSTIDIANIEPLTILYIPDDEYVHDELKSVVFVGPEDIDGKLTLTQELHDLTEDEENFLKLLKENKVKDYLRITEELYEPAIEYQRKIDNFVYLTDEEKEELNNQIDEAQTLFDEADNNNYEETDNDEWSKRKTNLLSLQKKLNEEQVLQELNDLLDWANEVGVPDEITVYKKSLEDLQKQDKWYANTPIPTPPTIKQGFQGFTE
jgi:vacuolar-type H+-ATPase subunit I/STV1